MKDIYFEKYENDCISNYSFFCDKLKKIESIVKKDDIGNYHLSNILWSNTLINRISQGIYPSDFFVKMVLNTEIINNIIINPIWKMAKNMISKFHYVPLHHNKLLIIDALLNQGSFPRYENDGKYIYSEHSGVISIKNYVVKNINVSAGTDRTDVADQTIFLPKNSPDFYKYEYLFHTHPNTKTYAGRIDEGIIYEFPSANDIFNFIKYRNEGKVQGSLVATPEGIYVIRTIDYQGKCNANEDLYYDLQRYTLQLEKKAMHKYSSYLDKLHDPDTFHKKVASNYKYINMYNDFIKSENLFIEYYPRIKKNNEWCLQPINLMYMDS